MFWLTKIIALRAPRSVAMNLISVAKSPDEVLFALPAAHRFAAVELVDGVQQQAGTAGELLRRNRAGPLVVSTTAAVSFGPKCFSMNCRRKTRARRAFSGAIWSSAIRYTRPGGPSLPTHVRLAERSLGPFDRDVDGSECGDWPLDAVLENLEIVLVRPATGLPVRVGDDDADRYRLDGRSESGSGCLLIGRWRSLPAAKEHVPAGGDERQGDEQARVGEPAHTNVLRSGNAFAQRLMR